MQFVDKHFSRDDRGASMRIHTAAGVALLAFAIAAPARAQTQVNHVALLAAADKEVALHAHELSHISKRGLTKAKAAPHVAGMLKGLDAADAHLAAVEKGPNTAPEKLAISEIRKDQEAARRHWKLIGPELDKAKIDPAAVKKHADGVDSAIDDAVDLMKKLPGGANVTATKH
jgi:hypothetical protein